MGHFYFVKIDINVNIFMDVFYRQTVLFSVSSSTGTSSLYICHHYSPLKKSLNPRDGTTVGSDSLTLGRFNFKNEIIVLIQYNKNQNNSYHGTLSHYKGNRNHGVCEQVNHNLFLSVKERSLINSSRCCLYIVVPLNHTSNLLDPFTKKYDARSRNGVVGINGNTIPTIPKLRKKNPNITNIIFFTFIGILPLFRRFLLGVCVFIQQTPLLS